MWPDRLDARKDGTEIRSPCDHLGRGLHSAPPRSGNLPRLAPGSGRPGHLLRQPGAAAPNRRRNATRLAPRACQLLRRGRGRPQSQTPFSRPSKRPSACSRIRPSAERYERRFLVASGGNASWRPGSQVISSWLQGRRFATGPRGCCSSAIKSISQTPPCLYYTAPKNIRRQNIMVTIPGPLLDGRPDQQELVLNNVVEVPLEYAREFLDGKWCQDWALGYALTVRSSQGLTVADPQKIWIIDDYLQWSNLAYLAVSRASSSR